LGVRLILAFAARSAGILAHVAARKEVHAQVIEAVQAVLAKLAPQGEGKELSSVRFPPFA
jgi:hypothetical protein